jgi:GntR family transcriptional regulator
VLGVSSDDEGVVIRARRFHANQVPIQSVTSYIPLTIAAGTAIEETDTGVGGLSSRLAELGHAQAEIEENITVRLPSPDEATFLQLSEDQRVYEIFHIGLTTDDAPVKVTIYTMPVHQWNLRYRYPVDPTGPRRPRTLTVPWVVFDFITCAKLRLNESAASQVWCRWSPPTLRI